MINMNDHATADLVASLAHQALVGARGDLTDALSLLMTALQALVATHHTRTDAAALLRVVAEAINHSAHRVESGPARPFAKA